MQQRRQLQSQTTTTLRPNNENPRITHRRNQLAGKTWDFWTAWGNWGSPSGFLGGQVPMGFVSIAPGGFSSLPGPARVALTSGREVAALGHHGCGTTDRQPRLPFPSSHPPPQPSSHLAGTSGIRSRLVKRLFLIGVWHHTLSFRSSNYLRPSLVGPDRGIGFLWRRSWIPRFLYCRRWRTERTLLSGGGCCSSPTRHVDD